MRETVSIQYLRAVAATMVVVYHAMTRVGAPGAAEPFAVGFWASGVDVFFVVSGFIMWSTTAERRVSTRQFLTARLQRILPLYWTALAACWLVFAFDRGIDGAPGALDVVRSALFIPYRDATTGFVAPFLTPGWTLTYEMIFYAVFAVALVLEQKAARLAFVGVVFVAMTSLRFRWGSDDPIAFRVTSPLFFEFLAGMAIAEIHRRLRDDRRAERVGYVAFGLAGLFIAFVAAPRFETLPRFVDFGVPAALLVLGATALEGRIATRPIGWLKRLGDASYSLYLAHDIHLQISTPWLAASGWPAPVQMALHVAGSLVVGLVVYAAVERPLTVWVKTWVRARAPAAAPLAPISVSSAPVAADTRPEIPAGAVTVAGTVPARRG